MTSPNFGALLDTPATEIERPKPYPAGSYTCVVKGLPRFDKSSKKQTEYVEFQFQPIAAGEDVDQEDLAAMGGLTRSIRGTYYITEDSLWRLKEVLEHMGLDENDGSLRQLLDQTPGKSLLVYLKHTANQDGTSVYAELSKTAPVE